jgi:hypothetical protein
MCFSICVFIYKGFRFLSGEKSVFHGKHVFALQPVNFATFLSMCLVYYYLEVAKLVAMIATVATFFATIREKAFCNFATFCNHNQPCNVLI